jgi:hypothetical protein
MFRLARVDAPHNLRLACDRLTIPSLTLWRSPNSMLAHVRMRRAAATTSSPLTILAPAVQFRFLVFASVTQ